ncbi:hypothetical protein ACFP1Z_27690 [Streptomyces gamaensis]|uniref:Uncharacterized protein n=1 Tax=Streptomyces gamaensis TaxID=1763542 RepID=A0ABW0ZA43_9ACTN
MSGSTAVYAPTGSNPVPRDISPWFPGSYGPSTGDECPMDLLIVRRDVGVRASAWPGIRRRLRHARAESVRTPRPRKLRADRPWEWSPHRLITLTTHAGTLVVSGPSWSLLRLGDALTHAGEHAITAADARRTDPVPLYPLTDLVRDGGPVPGDIEFDIYGVTAARTPATPPRTWPDTPCRP